MVPLERLLRRPFLLLDVSSVKQPVFSVEGIREFFAGAVFLAGAMLESTKAELGP